MNRKILYSLLIGLFGTALVLVFARGLRCEPREVWLRVSCFTAALVLAFPMLIFFKRIHERLGTIAISLLSLLFTFVVLDLSFALFPRSHSAGHTLAHLRWHELYYRPFENKQEYRDRDFTREELERGNTVLVVGDSFVAGSGVNKLEDRFTNILQSRLGSSYTVVNWGKPGNETPDETARLLKLDFNPEIIVLVYFGNDISKAWGQAGNIHPKIDPYGALQGRTRWWVEHSYLFNYFYWLFPRSDLQAMWNFLFDAWKSEKVLKIHADQLKDLFHSAEAKSKKVFLVVFPFLQSMEESKYVDWVESRAKENGIPTMDVRKLVTDLSVRERIVNYNDAHPSIEVHQRVGVELERRLRELGWLTR